MNALRSIIDIFVYTFIILFQDEEKAICCIDGHKFKVYRVVSEDIIEEKCIRCGKQKGENLNLNKTYPLTAERKRVHDDISILEYINKGGTFYSLYETLEYKGIWIKN